MKSLGIVRLMLFVLVLALVPGAAFAQVFTTEDAMVSTMAQEFQTMVKKEGMIVVRTAIKGIRLEGTEVSGPITPWLEKRVSDAILLNSREPVRLQLIDLGTFQKVDPDFVKQNPKLFSDFDAYLYGEYRQKGADLFLTIDLLSKSDLHTLGRFQATLSSKILPDLSLEPAHLAQTLVRSKTLDNQIKTPAQAVAHSDNPLKVSVTSSRGNGASFSDGESIVVIVSANKDAYIKLYHIDVNDQVQLIFPNRFQKNGFVKAGTVVQFPTPGAGFKFQLHEPFGTEFIKAVASTVPFESTETDFEELGSVGSGIMSRGLTVAAADLVNAETAEAKMNYSINAK